MNQSWFVDIPHRFELNSKNFESDSFKKNYHPVKTLIYGIFDQKLWYCTMWKLLKFTLTQKFRESSIYFIPNKFIKSWCETKNVLLKNYLRVDFTKKNFGERKFIVFPHYTAHCENCRNLLSPKKNIVKLTIHVEISLTKKLLSRNFCQKSVKVNFRNFHTALCTMHTSVALFSWNQIMVVVVVQFFLLTQTRVRKAGLERNVKRRKLWCYITQPFFFLMVHWFFSCHPWLILNNVHTCRYFC